MPLLQLPLSGRKKAHVVPGGTSSASDASSKHCWTESTAAGSSSDASAAEATASSPSASGSAAEGTSADSAEAPAPPSRVPTRPPTAPPEVPPLNLQGRSKVRPPSELRGLFGTMGRAADSADEDGDVDGAESSNSGSDDQLQRCHPPPGAVASPSCSIQLPPCHRKPAAPVSPLEAEAPRPDVSTASADDAQDTLAARKHVSDGQNTPAERSRAVDDQDAAPSALASRLRKRSPSPPRRREDRLESASADGVNAASVPTVTVTPAEPQAAAPSGTSSSRVPSLALAGGMQSRSISGSSVVASPRSASAGRLPQSARRSSVASALSRAASAARASLPSLMSPRLLFPASQKPSLPSPRTGGRTSSASNAKLPATSQHGAASTPTAKNTTASTRECDLDGGQAWAAGPPAPVPAESAGPAEAAPPPAAAKRRISLRRPFRSSTSEAAPESAAIAERPTAAVAMEAPRTATGSSAAAERAVDAPRSARGSTSAAPRGAVETPRGAKDSGAATAVTAEPPCSARGKKGNAADTPRSVSKNGGGGGFLSARWFRRRVPAAAWDKQAPPDAVAAAQAAWDAAAVASAGTTQTARQRTDTSRGAGARRLLQTPIAGDKEVVHLTRRLVTLAYEQTIPDETIAAIAAACPEIGWLVQCAQRAPQPSGWHQVVTRYVDAETGETREEAQPRYVHTETGESSEDMPLFPRFARMARLGLQARQNPEHAEAATAWLCAARDDALREAIRLQEGWTGPHIDPSTGAEYYHCVGTGVSSWGCPTASYAFIAHVANELLRSDLFPRSLAPGETACESLEELAREIRRTEAARAAPRSARAGRFEEEHRSGNVAGRRGSVSARGVREVVGPSSPPRHDERRKQRAEWSDGERRRDSSHRARDRDWERERDRDFGWDRDRRGGSRTREQGRDYDRERDARRSHGRDLRRGRDRDQESDSDREHNRHSRRRRRSERHRDERCRDERQRDERHSDERHRDERRERKGEATRRRDREEAKTAKALIFDIYSDIGSGREAARDPSLSSISSTGSSSTSSVASQRRRRPGNSARVSSGRRSARSSGRGGGHHSDDTSGASSSSSGCAATPSVGSRRSLQSGSRNTGRSASASRAVASARRLRETQEFDISSAQGDGSPKASGGSAAAALAGAAAAVAKAAAALAAEQPQEANGRDITPPVVVRGGSTSTQESNEETSARHRDGARGTSSDAPILDGSAQPLGEALRSQEASVAAATASQRTSASRTASGNVALNAKKENLLSGGSRGRAAATGETAESGSTSARVRAGSVEEANFLDELLAPAPEASSRSGGRRPMGRAQRAQEQPPSVAAALPEGINPDDSAVAEAMECWLTDDVVASGASGAARPSTGQTTTPPPPPSGAGAAPVFAAPTAATKSQTPVPASVTPPPTPVSEVPSAAAHAPARPSVTPPQTPASQTAAPSPVGSRGPPRSLPSVDAASDAPADPPTPVRKSVPARPVPAKPVATPAPSTPTKAGTPTKAVAPAPPKLGLLPPASSTAFFTAITAGVGSAAAKSAQSSAASGGGDECSNRPPVARVGGA